ncbi:porin [Pseudogulbenkiania subflava]|uniref:Outer membrane protein (Porin) n=1 Tax=Pseudogulbenkiania subflava DSM 22618 TaxID=1123014 RepID=A0A1Y6CBY0_9NEIS|nr:porin [Pseudogulbenkiania subflava]SMF55224.1 Outer membrane protein (porin) [Pseudogulbenkiania subflava DSM 22618]
MNKKLIAVALAALPVAAMADVTLYGTIEAGIENGKTYAQSSDLVDGKPVAGLFQRNADGKLKSGTRIDDTGSLIGFKGSEDLGNGLKAIWQVEQGLNIDGTTGPTSGNGYGNTFATRDSFVGLQGDFGKVRIGKLSTFNNSDMGNADSWIYGTGVNGLYYSSINLLDGRVNNAVRYDSPEFAGFRATALYGVDETRALNADGNRTNQAVWNLGLGYQNSGFYGNFGYVAKKDQGADNNKTDYYWRLEGGYAANNLSVDLYGGRQKFYSEDTEAKEAGVTVGYTIGALTPKFSYGRVWDIRDISTNEKVADNKINQYVIGVDYAMSKRTTSYVSFGSAHHEADDAQTERTFAVGLKHKF